MLSDRGIVSNKIDKYMVANGYTFSPKSKNYHALDSFVYEYINSGGVKDNLKIEINYMLRCHILPVEKRKVNLLWSDEAIKVLSVAPIEIFSSKTVALLSRTAPRDLYDIHNMVRFGVIDDDMKELYRKCVVFYSAISTEHPPKDFILDNIGNVTKMQIKRDLDPVLRKGESFVLNQVQEEVKNFMLGVLVARENEKLFWKSFSEKEYKPELIFDEDAGRIKKHPMALWKCRS